MTLCLGHMATTHELPTLRVVPGTMSATPRFPEWGGRAARPLPTTADLIQSMPGAARSCELAYVGIALHHFTDVLQDHLRLPIVDLHRATTILTKQVRSTVADIGSFNAVCHLVTDPERRAMTDGRTAAELCGASWAAVSEIAAEYASEGLQGIRSFGWDSVFHLATLHGCRSTIPWWGTRSWSARVDRWVVANRRHELAASLHDSPETMDLNVLTAVLEQ